MEVTGGGHNIAAADRLTFQRRHGIIGKSVEMREVVETIMQVAPTDITVLITGESGTGKEVIAKAIHNASQRSHRRFIPVNCGAIPEGILESELFGHEKGAFTGAVEARKGYFELADGGTIFLDEIGDTPISTQVKLLRVLESGEFMRVGSSEPRHTDVRVIAATNKNLEEEVRARRFRQDLFFRLRSVNLRLPPLRNRRGDIPPLVEVFLAEQNNAGREIMITDDGMNALMRHSWPGNVRELRNVIESVAVLERGNVVDEQTVSKYIHAIEEPLDDRALPVPLGKSSEQAERELIFRMLVGLKSDIQDLHELLEDFRHQRPLSLPVREEQHGDEIHLDGHTLRSLEESLITRTLERFHGNRRLAAEALDISERTLYRKIKDYGL
ncbi:sigma 54-interacting transcriptional regulator [bacterium]|nr:sigma 54-interacting transcriptional regulator [bacterium]